MDLLIGFRDPQIFQHLYAFLAYFGGVFHITWSGQSQGSICRRRQNACAWSEAGGWIHPFSAPTLRCPKKATCSALSKSNWNKIPIWLKHYSNMSTNFEFMVCWPYPPYLDTSSILPFAGHQFWAELKAMVSSEDIPTQPIHCQVLTPIISHFHCIPMTPWEFPRISSIQLYSINNPKYIMGYPWISH